MRKDRSGDIGDISGDISGIAGKINGDISGNISEMNDVMSPGRAPDTQQFTSFKPGDLLSPISNDGDDNKPRINIFKRAKNNR